MALAYCTPRMEWLYTTRPWPQAFEVCAIPWQLPWTSHPRTTKRRTLHARLGDGQLASAAIGISEEVNGVERVQGSGQRGAQMAQPCERHGAVRGPRPRRSRLSGSGSGHGRGRRACGPRRRVARRGVARCGGDRHARCAAHRAPARRQVSARRGGLKRIGFYTNLRTAHASTMTTRFRLSNHTISDGIGTRKGLFDHTMRLQRVMLLLTLFLQPAACGRGLRSAHQPATI